jgi:hypothetical protein
MGLLCEGSNDLGGDVEEENGGDERKGQDNDDEWVAGGSVSMSTRLVHSLLLLAPLRRKKE